MKIKLKLMSFLFVSILLAITSCSSDDEEDIDTERPTISINYAEGFPQACEELQRGETYTFKAMVSDNFALATYSINMHHNFDHHTHDDQIGDCVFHEDKNPINPLLLLENYTISGNPQNYEINIEVQIPNDVDTGDYHCQFSVTDQTGWQSQTSIDIKIID